MENPINHRDLEGIVVKPVNSSAVAQAKTSRFDPFEGRLFGPFLIFKNLVFLSVIVNEFEFVYLARLSVFHSPLPRRWFRLHVGGLLHLQDPATANGSYCRCRGTGRSHAPLPRHARSLRCLVRAQRAAACSYCVIIFRTQIRARRGSLHAPEGTLAARFPGPPPEIRMQS